MVGDHMGILGAVVFAFCHLREARVDKDPWECCHWYGLASCALRERLCSRLYACTILYVEPKPYSGRSAIVQLLLLLRVTHCMSHCTLKIDFRAPRAGHRVPDMSKNLPTKFGDKGTTVAKVMRDTVLPHGGLTKVLCMLTTR
jgi:hypothetical protein